MTALQWDTTGQRRYETGVDHGVLYIPTNGIYNNGVAWNGLTAVTETPSGAEANPMYADNMKYLNLFSLEQFGATIEAYTYPDEFVQFDGSVVPQVGVVVGQQTRKSFGLSYRTKLGNDVLADDYAYKLHLIYGASAMPSERAYSTINDSPEIITFSWELTTVATPVTGLKPTSILTIDSSKVNPVNLGILETALYGGPGVDPRLPLPDEVITMFAGTVTLVTPTSPTFVAGTGVITIPTVTGVQYRRADTGAVITGTYTIPTSGASFVITANPVTGAYAFTALSDDDWSFTRV